MCDYSRKPVKWQVGNFSFIIDISMPIVVKHLLPLFDKSNGLLSKTKQKCNFYIKIFA